MLFPFCKFKKIATFEQVSCGNFASSSDRWRYTWAEDERLTMSGFFPCDFYEGGGGVQPLDTAPKNLYNTVYMI